MPTRSFWTDSSALPAFPPLAADLTVDVVVIGGGLTGVTAAYLLAKAGKRVALLERDRVGSGDTCHTTAHLTQATDDRLSELVKTFGKDHARAAWDAGRAAIEFIHETAHAEGIDCDFRWVPGYLHGPKVGDTKGDVDALKADAELANELGFEAAFVDAVPVAGTPGVRFARQAEFHPLKYLAGLVAALSAAGGHVFEQSNVSEVTADPLAVKANGHTVRCEYVVIATHVPLTGVKGIVGAALFQTKIAPYTSYAVGARAPRGAVPEALFWDTQDPYFYLRCDRRSDHDFLVFGGRDHKTGQVADTEERFRELEAALAAYAPAAVVSHRWSGQVVETHDGLPYIGETAPAQFAATGFSGNGMTFGTLGGMMAADAALGRKNPWSELFSPSRKKLSSAWDYLKENVDYPYYMVRERLRAAEGSSPADVKPGDGKILKLGGERVAAYRDFGGTLSTVSATCTHMGCLVRWNGAERTWDCPCHGSRFRPTGEVLAGPAETPLEPVSPANG